MATSAIGGESEHELDVDTRRTLARYLLGNIQEPTQWRKSPINERLLFLARDLDPENLEIQLNTHRWMTWRAPRIRQFYDQQKSAIYFYEVAKFLKFRGGEGNEMLAKRLAELARALGGEPVDTGVTELFLAPADWSFIHEGRELLEETPEVVATRRIDALTVRMGGLGDWSGSRLQLSLTAQTEPPGKIGRVGLEGDLENIGPAFRGSVSTAGEAIRKLRPNGRRISLKYERSGTGKLDGASAGLAMAVMAKSALDDIPLAERVAVTGTFQPPVGVGQVSGVAYKVAAARGDIVIVPFGVLEEVQDLLLMGREKLLWKRQVIGCRTLDEAMELARRDRPERIRTAMKLFAQARESQSQGESRKARMRLEAVLELIPTHYSAQILLRQLDGERPKRLSHATSLGKVGSVMQDFVICIMATSKYGFRAYDKLAPKILQRVEALQGTVSPAAESWLIEVRTILMELRAMRSLALAGEPVKERLRALMVRADTLDSLLEQQLSVLAFLIQR